MARESRPYVSVLREASDWSSWLWIESEEEIRNAEMVVGFGFRGNEL